MVVGCFSQLLIECDMIWYMDNAPIKIMYV